MVAISVKKYILAGNQALEVINAAITINKLIKPFYSFFLIRVCVLFYSNHSLSQLQSAEDPAIFY